MNGRIYDPLLGRFLSADTYIQFPNDLQSYNRYSYVHNNPLTYDDPSGHFLNFIVGGVVGGAIGAIAGGVTAYIASDGDWNAVAAGAAGGAVGGAIVGSGVGIIAAGVAAGTTTAGGAIVASTAVGASGGVIGNTVGQYTENRLNGQSPSQALGNIDSTEQVVAGAVGGATGALSGAAVVAKQAVINSMGEAQQSVAAHVTGPVAQNIRQMASSDETASAIITKVVSDASQSMAQNAASMTRTVVTVSATEAVVLPAAENVLTTAINEEPQAEATPVPVMQPVEDPPDLLHFDYRLENGAVIRQ
jgi:hypothetical protein